MARQRDRHVSNTAADRAGQFFRDWVRRRAEGRDFDPEEEREFLQSLRTAAAYRAMHVYPMTKVTMGVRSMVRTATGNESLRPGQRFKRMDRILFKLLRHPHMRLSQMEDIGGCRVVLPSVEDVYAVSNRIMGQWGDRARLTDYIAEPKRDGYRGIHIVERRDGRMVEVQLRTIGQQAWATVMEEYSPVTGYNLKDGDGPDDLRRYLFMAAERIARDERGEPLDAAAEAEFDTVRNQVRPYFQRQR